MFSGFEGHLDFHTVTTLYIEIVSVFRVRCKLDCLKVIQLKIIKH